MMSLTADIVTRRAPHCHAVNVTVLSALCYQLSLSQPAAPTTIQCFQDNELCSSVIGLLSLSTKRDKEDPDIGDNVFVDRCSYSVVISSNYAPYLLREVITRLS